MDTVPGLGPARRAALLEQFRTVRAIRAASPEELGERAVSDKKVRRVRRDVTAQAPRPAGYG